MINCRIDFLAGLLLTIHLSAHAEELVVLKDSMSYSDSSSLQASWIPEFGNLPQLQSEITLSPSPLANLRPNPSGGAFLALNNGVCSRELDVQITRSWALTGRFLSTNYSRGQGIWLLDKTGSYGYGIYWNTTQVNQNNGNGLVSISRFENDDYSSWQEFGQGTNLISMNSGHPVTGFAVTQAVSSAQNSANYDTESWQDFAEFSLRWDKDTRTLTLSIDGVQVQQVVDSRYAVFRKVYIRGNTTGYFDDITLTVNETKTPAAAEWQKRYGAKVDFITYEAENSQIVTNAQVVQITDNSQMSAWPRSAAMEASGRGYVELNQSGHFLELTNEANADGLVIRHCIPDAPQGGGEEHTLSLYVNDVFRQKIVLSSKYNWLYGTGVMWGNGQSNTPTSDPHVFWDESRYIIEGGLNVGDRLRLQKDISDTADYYRIDLVELEPVPPPLAPPEEAYLSVTDFGANGSDDQDDAVAISICIYLAKTSVPKKKVWIPPGKYLIKSTLSSLDGVVMAGAGMWHTTLVHNQSMSSTRIFDMSGSGSSVSDLTIDSESCTNRQSITFYPFGGNGSHWSIKRVWITHTPTGFWLSGDNGEIADCRLRTLYADGININSGNSTKSARDIIVQNNHIRGVGDDALAILDQQASSGSTKHITLRNNTAVAVWWGNSCDLAGGEGHVIENNYLLDGPGFVINLPSAYPMKSVRNSVFRRNRLVRCGSNLADQMRGAIWTLPQSGSIDGIVIENNRIEDPLFRGIHIRGPNTQNLVIRGNVIEGVKGESFYVTSDSMGTSVWDGNVSVDASGISIRNNSISFNIMLTESISSWLMTTFTIAEQADASMSDPFADPDGDGLKNTFEYAFGTNPLAFDKDVNFPWTKVMGENFSYIHFEAKGRDDLKYSVEWSLDLNQWQPCASETVTTDALGLWKRSIGNESLNSAKNQFFRLRVNSF